MCETVSGAAAHPHPAATEESVQHPGPADAQGAQNWLEEAGKIKPPPIAAPQEQWMDYAENVAKAANLPAGLVTEMIQSKGAANASGSHAAGDGTGEQVYGPLSVHGGLLEGGVYGETSHALKDSAGKALTAEAMSDPAKAITAGVQHLKQLVDLYEGDTTKALNHYETGDATNSEHPLKSWCDGSTCPDDTEAHAATHGAEASKPVFKMRTDEAESAGVSTAAASAGHGGHGGSTVTESATATAGGHGGHGGGATETATATAGGHGGHGGGATETATATAGGHGGHSGGATETATATAGGHGGPGGGTITESATAAAGGHGGHGGGATETATAIETAGGHGGHGGGATETATAAAGGHGGGVHAQQGSAPKHGLTGLGTDRSLGEYITPDSHGPSQHIGESHGLGFLMHRPTHDAAMETVFGSPSSEVISSIQSTLEKTGTYLNNKPDTEKIKGAYLTGNMLMKQAMLPAGSFGSEKEAGAVYAQAKLKAIDGDVAGLKSLIASNGGDTFGLTDDQLLNVWATNEHNNLHGILDAGSTIGQSIHMTSLNDGAKDKTAKGTLGGYNDKGAYPQWGWFEDAKSVTTLFGVQARQGQAA
ncbi:MAG: hypothetical protein O9274_10435 [Limnobacter sp.]|uniref:hypothetical protein n=1 Tax=Limnobacter sp. TaxID=2003368 RepID=UPI0022CAE03F|nr:hypothetical protein [Limnobacter sp.]MCZ8016104.1 hypothetical protein [Limnobacter sp.]